MNWTEILTAIAPIVVALISVVANALTNRKGTRKQIEALEKKLDAHVKEDEDYKAKQARTRILRFSDECSRGDLHSENFFDDVLEDIDYYERYCTSHPDFRNNKGQAAMARIKEVYAKCKKNNTFLK